MHELVRDADAMAVPNMPSIPPITTNNSISANDGDNNNNNNNNNNKDYATTIDAIETNALHIDIDGDNEEETEEDTSLQIE